MSNKSASFKLIGLFFFIVIAVRFAFYGLQTVLPLYLHTDLNFASHNAIYILSSVVTLLFCFVAISGYLGDKILGNFEAMILGIIIFLGGVILLIINNVNVYITLSCIGIGNSLILPNLTALIARSHLVKPQSGTDGFFTLYYVAINIGSLLGISSFLYFLGRSSSVAAFILSAVVLVLALVVALGRKSILSQFNMGQPRLLNKSAVLTNCLIILAIWGFSFALQNGVVLYILFGLAMVVMVGLLLKEYYESTRAERDKLFCLAALTVFALVFFIPFWQSWNLTNYLILYSTSYRLFGFEITPDFFRELVPFLIIIFGPLLAFIYNYLGQRNKDLTIPYKFAIGILIYGISFLLLAFGIYWQQQQEIISSGWVFSSYVMQAIAELLVGALGLSMVAKLSPKRITGFAIGVWLTTTGVGLLIGRYLLSFIQQYNTQLAQPNKITYVYNDLFLTIGLVMGCVAIALLFMAPYFAKYFKSTQSSSKARGHNVIVSSISKRLSQRNLVYTVVCALVVSIALLVALNIVSRSVYSHIESKWLNIMKQQFKEDMSDQHIEDLRNKISLLKSTDLFSKFVVMDDQFNRIAGFGFDKQTAQPQKPLQSTIRNVKFFSFNRSLFYEMSYTPIKGPNGKIYGYYYYQSNFNHYFLPYLWLGIICLILILLSYGLMRVLFKSDLKKEFSKFNLFINHIESITNNLSQFANLPQIETTNSSAEEKKINQIISHLIEQINYSQQEIERITQQVEKQKSQAQLSKVAAQVAHDIRSPLTALNSLLSQADDLPERQRLMMRNAVQRINDIANNLLAEYKHPQAQQNQYSGEVEACLIYPIIDQVVSEKRQILENNQSLEFEVADRQALMSYAKVNRAELARVISNLVNNALEATDSIEGLIKITLITNNDELKVMITDNGPGMTEEQLNSIMSGDQHITSTKSDGHGIGITHAQETLSRFGASFNISSTLGKGTTVELIFKAVPAPLWIARELTIYPYDTIVILDDDPSMLDAWDRLFAQYSARLPNEVNIKYFTNGEQCVNTLQTWQTCHQVLLLADYELMKQNLNGLDVVEATLVPRSVLVTSHYESSETIKRAILLGTYVLPKELSSSVQLVIEDEPLAEPDVTETDLVLLEDNRDFAQTVEYLYRFQGEGSRLAVYQTPYELFYYLPYYSKDTPICLDYQLGCPASGLDIAQVLHDRGYRKLYLATGFSMNQQELPDYIQLIKNKMDITYL